MEKPILIRNKKRTKLKEFFLRLLYFKLYKLKFILKIIIKNKYINNQSKVLSIFFLVNLMSYGQLSKHNNICFKTSWRRSVNPFFKLNRLSLIKYSEQLLIPGLFKAKW